MSNLIQELFKTEYLQTGEIEGKHLYHLTTPCRFNIKKDTVKSLRDNYLADEEIGGLLWAKPMTIEGEKVYIIDQVTYLRNAIEDTEYKDKHGRIRTKKDAYRPDRKSFSDALQKIISVDYLPVKFHTHPTKGRHVLDNLTLQQIQTETSEQDINESSDTQQIGDDHLLMPRALIVGNGDLSSNIFIGFYNGFIAPVNFEESKRKVQQENLERIGNSISSTNFTDEQKVLLGIGAILLLIAVVKYPKYSLPVIFGLALTTPMLLTDTTTTEKPSFFNKLSFGDANIYIP